MRSADGEWTTAYLDAGEVVAIHAALDAFVPEPEVRGYVVLVPGGAAGTFEVGATGIIFPDAGQASVEAAWAEREFGLTGAHVGVVTVLPALTEGDATP